MTARTLAFCALISSGGWYVVRAADMTLQPQPIAMSNFPTPESTLNGWINTNDSASIRAHAWALWQGMAAKRPSSAGYPVWETWYTDVEVQGGPPNAPPRPGVRAIRALRSRGRAVHSFERLRQFQHTRLSNRFIAPLAAHSEVDDQVVGFQQIQPRLFELCLEQQLLQTSNAMAIAEFVAR